jgi:hypothetical protein
VDNAKKGVKSFMQQELTDFVFAGGGKFQTHFFGLKHPIFI